MIKRPEYEHAIKNLQNSIEWWEQFFKENETGPGKTIPCGICGGAHGVDLCPQNPIRAMYLCQEVGARAEAMLAMMRGGTISKAEADEILKEFLEDLATKPPEGEPGGVSSIMVPSVVLADDLLAQEQKAIHEQQVKLREEREKQIAEQEQAMADPDNCEECKGLAVKWSDELKMNAPCLACKGTGKRTALEQ